METNLLRAAIRLIVLSGILFGIWWLVSAVIIPALLSLVGVSSVL